VSADFRVQKGTVSFWTHHTYDPVTGCWNWTGGGSRGDRSGYGRIYYLGRRVKVHRLSAHFYLGFDLDSPLHVLHRCDNPRCFNPKHLFIGTHQDNMQDAKNKGRMGGECKDFCKRGHPLNAQTTYLRMNGWRGPCKECCKLRYLKRKKLHAVG
jgi:hypothetical protein